jgi:hypothetical protein
VHEPSYVDYIDGMWPSETKKKDMYVEDTYFN